LSAHRIPQRRGWLSALTAQVSDYVFETVEDTVEQAPARLEPYPVVAVVSAAPRSGATTVARLLAAELAIRAEGAAVVTSSTPIRRSAPPARAAARLAIAMTGLAVTQPMGRICIVRAEAAPSADRSVEAAPSALANIVSAGRYLAPVVLDLPPDGSAAGIAGVADAIAVVCGAAGEPALMDAVAMVVGGAPAKVVNRVVDADRWAARADVLLPESRIAARAVGIGTRALGPLGTAIAALADRLVG
jgi:hypothetical protein